MRVSFSRVVSLKAPLPKMIHLCSLFLLCCLSLSSAADPFTDTVDNFRQAAGTTTVFDQAYGYAVFPNIGKGGIGIGAAFGRGKVFINGKLTGDVTMSQLSIGFQLGGQAYSQIIFFKDLRAYEEFTAGSFEFGAQATAVAITLGASIEASTKGASVAVTTGSESQAVTEYYKGMAVYTITRGGLMYEASIGGQKFKFRELKNKPELKDLSHSRAES